MILPAPAFAPRVGESGGARVVRVVRAYVGCSLVVNRDALAALVGRGVQDESIVAWRTNCATFALGVLSAAGCPHPRLLKPTAIGAAFSDLVTIGTDMGAWRVPAPSETIPPGAALWYEVQGENDDHVEFMLSPPDEHGGGGRPGNAITSGVGPIAGSLGRPLHRWLDPAAIGLPDAIAPELDPREAETRPGFPLPFHSQSTLPPPKDT